MMYTVIVCTILTIKRATLSPREWSFLHFFDIMTSRRSSNLKRKMQMVFENLPQLTSYPALTTFPFLLNYPKELKGDNTFAMYVDSEERETMDPKSDLTMIVKTG